MTYLYKEIVNYKTGKEIREEIAECYVYNFVKYQQLAGIAAEWEKKKGANIEYYDGDQLVVTYKDELIIYEIR